VRCRSGGTSASTTASAGAEGGPNEEWNLVTLCEDCHLAQHRRAQLAEIERQPEDALLLGLL